MTNRVPPAQPSRSGKSLLSIRVSKRSGHHECRVEAPLHPAVERGPFWIAHARSVVDDVPNTDPQWDEDTATTIFRSPRTPRGPRQTRDPHGRPGTCEHRTRKRSPDRAYGSSRHLHRLRATLNSPRWSRQIRRFGVVPDPTCAAAAITRSPGPPGTADQVYRVDGAPCGPTTSAEG